MKKDIFWKTAEMIVDVIRPGTDDDSSDEVLQAKEHISKRYSELKRNHSFYESSNLSRIEWIANFLKDKFEIDGEQ